MTHLIIIPCSNLMLCQAYERVKWKETLREPLSFSFQWPKIWCGSFGNCEMKAMTENDQIIIFHLKFLFLNLSTFTYWERLYPSVSSLPDMRGYPNPSPSPTKSAQLRPPPSSACAMVAASGSGPMFPFSFSFSLSQFSFVSPIVRLKRLPDLPVPSNLYLPVPCSCRVS